MLCIDALFKSLRLMLNGLDASIHAHLHPCALLLNRSTPQLQRAYVLLGQLVHAWVHGHRVPWHSGVSSDGGTESTDDDRTRVVPRQLSVPFHSVCVRLGMPCVLTAAGQDLWNWAMIDPTEGMTAANLRCLSTITGTRSEVGFHAVPCAMNFRLGKDGLLLDVFNLPHAVAQDEMGAVASTLRRLAHALQDCIDIFGQVGVCILCLSCMDDEI